MVIEAGRMYRAINEDGEVGEPEVARAVVSDLFGEGFEIGALFVHTNGRVPYLKDYRVELVQDGAAELPDAGDAPDVVAAPIAVPEPETLDERHAADLADLGSTLQPRLSPQSLEVRRTHALERIAESLDALVGAAFEGLERTDAGGDAGDEETVQ